MKIIFVKKKSKENKKRNEENEKRNIFFKK